MSMDLVLTIQNPFQSSVDNLRQYELFAWTLGLLSGFSLVLVDNASNASISSTLRVPSGDFFLFLTSTTTTTTTPTNVHVWVFYYAWVLAFVLVSVIAMILVERYVF